MVLLTRIHKLVKKNLRFYPESRAITMQECIQRIHEKSIFKNKAFGSKLKDDVIKSLQVRYQQNKEPQEVRNRKETQGEK